jgi:hypothetical protein
MTDEDGSAALSSEQDAENFICEPDSCDMKREQ